MSAALTAGLRVALLSASRNAFLRRSAARYGMRLGAARFVAGESLDELVRVARRLNAEGYWVSTSILGEGTTSAGDAARVAAEYFDLLERLARENLRANVALKLTHLGLALGPELAAAHLFELLSEAARLGAWIRVDMEESRYVAPTLAVYERAREARLDNVGVVLQAYLRRTAADLERLLPLAPNLRLVKGAYLEPSSVAFARKTEVDANYVALIARAFEARGFTAIATHDEAIVRQTIALAERRGLARTCRYEFQMLYGIRPDLQRRLVEEGHTVRIAAPYGRDWYPYFLRRLAERPANLAFVLQNVLKR